MKTVFCMLYTQVKILLVKLVIYKNIKLLINKLMFLYHYCKEINDNTFDEKLSLSKLSELILQFELKEIGFIKEYWINNVQIISNNGKLEFNYIEDKDILYDKKNSCLIQNFIKKPCNIFSIYNVDLEDKYLLYENIINDITINLKKYSDYLSLEFTCDNKEKFNDFFYIYNI